MQRLLLLLLTACVSASQTRDRPAALELIIAGTTDVAPVLYAARWLYGRMLRAGIRVFEWKGRVLHAKTAVVDGRWATIGSANLDAQSLRTNLEVNAVFEDEAVAAAAEAMFNQDLYECQQITLEQWQERPLGEIILSWLAYRVRAWL